MNTPATDDRENLCALFDGELQGEAARFALKRLGHDAQWRQACGRWQLYGDVLRGQATAMASSSFADRVAQAIAHEPALAPIATSATSSSPRRSASASRRGWIGGALAASVAVAALFVTRPFLSETAPAADDGATTQVAAAATAPDIAPLGVPSPSVPSPSVPDAPDAPDHQAGLGAAAVAAVEVPRRAAERRSTRSQSQRAALRASRQSAPTAATAVAAVAPASAVASTVAMSATGTDAVAPKPFQPQHPEATARPWPRAVLPQYAGSGAGITASYGSGASSPSFYPFEPSMTPAADQTGVTENDSAGPRN
ncbi:sigma-E factor negative regulatory protein [Lysobacter sp. S4-A87]|uniref:sigma-E factor negative regulatory protein n=1 Tax=Lysobacter sp. S4-A87 TaxID=2925843 RepID=UPI001F52FD13|nr:sigma-E factor negative regulatory protein [Lysobacter sp. S4-A87]UNK50397.1 sigma-E factor negative regulatory protein [Lysobacter sp. S4-A87]